MDYASYLQKYRQLRQFNPNEYIQAKVSLINQYLTLMQISAVVIGVSGGVDSAVSLALLKVASQQPNSPIRKIVAVLAPEFVPGATQQYKATRLGYYLVTHLNQLSGVPIQVQLIDLTKTHQQVQTAVLSTHQTLWANGQLVSYLRTPVMYYMASLLYESHTPAIVIGTTNLDEGGYIGYFGKASDGMVDVQIISDIHKSEVYILGQFLHVPNVILEAIPSGDLFNGASDLEYIGAPYDAIELYTGYLMNQVPELPDTFQPYQTRLDELHNQARHKYYGTGYAVHLNLYSINVQGGLYIHKRISDKPVSSLHFINHQELNLMQILEEDKILKDIQTITNTVLSNQVQKLNHLLSDSECHKLRQLLEPLKWIPVSIHGRIQDYQPGQTIGSYRLSSYNVEFANQLWSRIQNHLKPYIFDSEQVMRPVGVNPLFRFIRYDTIDNYLIPHYDAPYEFPNSYRKTLKSLIIYVTTSKSGATRFILDDETINPSFEDWDKPPQDDQIKFRVEPRIGQGLIFDHRILHDSEPVAEIKLIIRSDIIYEPCLPNLPEISSQASNQSIIPTRPLNFKLFNSTYNLDPYYASAVQTHNYSKATLIQSGYLTTQRRQEPDIKFLGTPYYKISHQLQLLKEQKGTYGLNHQPLYVLVNTGCYDPLHLGHVAMMESAYRYLNQRGHYVLGGYVVPAHTKYVQEKNGQDQPHIRLQQNYDLIHNHPWLSVDPYELLYEHDDVNYTSILIRIETYLRHHLHPKIQIAYVCGSDRAEFVRTFSGGYGTFICIQRPKSQKMFETMQQQYPHTTYSNLHWISDLSLDVSSTQLRVKVSENLKVPENLKVSGIPTESLIYHLRKETCDLTTFSGRAYDQFCNSVLNLFQFSFSQAPEFNQSISFEFLKIGDQEKTLFKASNMISLDPMITLNYNFHVSRLYEVATPQSFIKVVSRPGFPALNHQVDQIPPGQYYLMDDDSVTGTTMNTVSQLLPQVQVLDRILLSSEVHRYDVTDCRDLLLGSRLGGLVIQLPNQSLARVPYMLPYVFPSDRCKIPLSQNWSVSIQLWRLNLAYYEAYPQIIQDIDVTSQALLLYIGFSLEHTLAYVCLWHLMKLNISLPIED